MTTTMAQLVTSRVGIGTVIFPTQPIVNFLPTSNKKASEVFKNESHVNL
jgi:hypothetical protein